jgi:hypothetical protein
MTLSDAFAATFVSPHRLRSRKGFWDGGVDGHEFPWLQTPVMSHAGGLGDRIVVFFQKSHALFTTLSLRHLVGGLAIVVGKMYVRCALQ